MYGDGGSSQIQELQQMHSQKVRTLLRSNDTLKKQMTQLKKEQKDNYRVKMIRNLRLKVRELESMNEVLKIHAMRKGATIDEIDDIYEGVLNEPKRARPVRPETLQREISDLKRENERLGKAVDQAQAAAGKKRGNRPVTSGGGRTAKGRNGKGGLINSAHEMDLLQSELAAKDEVIDIHKQMLQSVQTTNRAAGQQGQGPPRRGAPGGDGVGEREAEAGTADDRGSERGQLPGDPHAACAGGQAGAGPREAAARAGSQVGRQAEATQLAEGPRGAHPGPDWPA